MIYSEDTYTLYVRLQKGPLVLIWPRGISPNELAGVEAIIELTLQTAREIAAEVQADELRELSGV